MRSLRLMGEEVSPPCARWARSWTSATPSRSTRPPNLPGVEASADATASTPHLQRPPHNGADGRRRRHRRRARAARRPPRCWPARACASRCSSGSGSRATTSASRCCPRPCPILEELGVRCRRSRRPASCGSSAPRWSGARRRSRGAGTSARRTCATPTPTRCGGPQFDQILLDASRAAGVEVREGIGGVVGALRGRASRRGRHRRRRRPSTPTSWSTPAGQRALVGHALGLRRWDRDFRNMAVYGYFEGAGRLDPPDETNILVESYGEGWFWVIPLHVGVVSVGAVVDAAVGALPGPGRRPRRVPPRRDRPDHDHPPVAGGRVPRRWAATRCGTGPTRPTAPWATATSSSATPPASSTRCSPPACTSPCRRG